MEHQAHKMRVISTRVADIFKDENDVIHIVMNHHVIVDREDIADVNLVLRQLSEGKPSLKVLDSRPAWDMSEDAKKYAEQMHNPVNTIARAILTTSKISSLLFNFLQKFNSPAAPQRFFSDEKKAYKWLMKFKAGRKAA